MSHEHQQWHCSLWIPRFFSRCATSFILFNSIFPLHRYITEEKWTQLLTSYQMTAATLSHAGTLNTDWVNFPQSKMQLLVFCWDKGQKHSSSDWLKLIFACDQHECWPLASRLIFASPRKFMERSQSCTNFLRVCLCACMCVCVRGDPLLTLAPCKGWPCPLTALVSCLWKSGPTYTNSKPS